MTDCRQLYPLSKVAEMCPWISRRQLWRMATDPEGYDMEGRGIFVRMPSPANRGRVLCNVEKLNQWLEERAV